MADGIADTSEIIDSERKSGTAAENQSAILRRCRQPVPDPGNRTDDGKQEQREPEDAVNPSGILAQGADVVWNPLASSRRQRELHLDCPLPIPKGEEQT